MRAIQDNAIGNKGFLDVSANFYVSWVNFSLWVLKQFYWTFCVYFQLGGDGNIYIGRGWDAENAYGDKSLAIHFLGDFMRFELEPKQFESLKYLLNYGKARNFLSTDYRLFGLNQTKLSKYSPGVNVMKIIKTLPEFSSCGETGYEACGNNIGIKWILEKALKWSETYEFKVLMLETALNSLWKLFCVKM